MANGTGTLYETTVKLSQNHSMISTCYHEAGHTIAGLLMFMKVPSVSVEKARRISGETNYEMIDDDAVSNAELLYYFDIAQLNIYYAGMVAERILYKDITGSSIWPKVLKEGCEDDISNAAIIIKKKNLAPPGKPRYNFKKKIMRNLSDLLLKHWDGVKLISHALFEKKRLSHDDLKEILIKKSDNKEFWKQQFKYINLYVDQNKSLDSKDIRIILNRKY